MTACKAPCSEQIKNEEICIREFLLSNILKLEAGRQERKNTDISNPMKNKISCERKA